MNNVGAPHPAGLNRRRPAPVSAGLVVLTAITFLFTGWMITCGHSPQVAVLTSGAVLLVTTTLGRSALAGARPFTARFGFLPPAGTSWQENDR